MEETEKLLQFLQKEGFIWGPEPEIYGGKAGFYTYAPMGKLLKNNVENYIRKHFQEENFWEVECPTIMPKIVWKASGHLDSFTDKVVECKNCSSSFKADEFVDEINVKDLKKFFKEKKIKCPNCGSVLSPDLKEHNLMMKTTIGLDEEAYFRPETATTTYLPFKRYYEHFRKKLPFGVFQIGKAYRNEISPRKSLIRLREFIQAEAQMFIFEKQKNSFKKYEKYKNLKIPLLPEEAQGKKEQAKKITLNEALKKKHFKSKAYAYAIALTYELFKGLGIEEKNIRFREHPSAEKIFYAYEAWDLEVKLNTFGWTEMVGVHDRTDYDLKQHQKFSNQPMSVFNIENNEKEIPNIIEIAFGCDRPIYALFDLFYDVKSREKGKTIFKVPVHLSPVKIAVLPLVNKDKIPEMAESIYKELNENTDLTVSYDDTASIGKRYLRQTMKGTALCLTVDYDSLKDKTVTLRERDTGKQIRVKRKDIIEKVNLFLKKGKF
ncbi:glycine--tRNA ligase [Candidatus Woesearchaeota archaeon]|nr:glycine--tRNA ligase [Candidatus Woesearchaeota archaeon]